MLVAMAGLLVLVMVHADTYGKLWAQPFEVIIQSVYNRFDGIEVKVVRYKSEPGYQLEVSSSLPLTVGAGKLPAGVGITSFTLLAHSVQHLVFLFIVIGIGRCYISTSTYRILALTCVAIIVIESLDVPFVLIGSIEDLLLSSFEPGAETDSFWVGWMNIMNNGGRIGLCMITGWLIVLASRIRSSA
jgi:hypothetical protein